MDIIQEQDAAYYKSIHDELEREFREAEKKLKEQERVKEEKKLIEIENEPEPPKPTKEQLRELRLRKLESRAS